MQFDSGRFKDENGDGPETTSVIVSKGLSKVIFTYRN